MTKQHFTRRSFLKGLAMTGAGAALAACAAPAAPAATDSGDEMPAAEAVMLRVQAPAGNGALMPSEFATRFADQTGVQVEVEDTIYGEIETKTQTGYISGTLQDLVYGHHRWIFINFLKGIYLEIDDLLDTAPPDDFDDFYPSVLEGNQWEGKNFSLPDVVHNPVATSPSTTTKRCWKKRDCPSRSWAGP